MPLQATSYVTDGVHRDRMCLHAVACMQVQLQGLVKAYFGLRRLISRLRDATLIFRLLRLNFCCLTLGFVEVDGLRIALICHVSGGGCWSEGG